MMTRPLLAHDILHSHFRDYDLRDGSGFLGFFFFLLMVIASISVLAMIIFACGQDPEKGSGDDQNVSYYGSDGRYVSSAGGGDGGGTGCGGGCGGCGGGCS